MNTLIRILKFLLGKKSLTLYIIGLTTLAAQGQFKKLVWADEFNYTGLPDSKKWGYDTGGNGWGNRELEYYTSKRLENARVEKGVLVIEARKEDYRNGQFTSARLVSKNKGDW